MGHPVQPPAEAGSPTEATQKDKFAYLPGIFQVLLHGGAEGAAYRKQCLKTKRFQPKKWSLVNNAMLRLKYQDT